MDHRDSVFITYGDTFYDPTNKSKKGLKNLDYISKKYLKSIFTTIHLLPIHPFSSDDGFSVIDYKKVRPDLGTWNDVKNLQGGYKIMLDCVINHASIKSGLFKKDPSLFLSFSTPPEVSSVFRPRTTPLLTKVNGRYFWTTFSKDQVDFDYSNPRTLLTIIDVLLFYESKNSSFLRFDAVAFLYKDLKTSSINLPQTHSIIKIFRKILSRRVKVIAELNLPEDQINQYYGDGDEADLTYNFPLAPIVLYCLISKNTRPLKKLISAMDPDEIKLNFLASHDGIGLLAAKKYLGVLQINKLIKLALDKGFAISKKTINKKELPYELNINYLDALDSDPQKLIVAHSILISIPGIPAIYAHSLFGQDGLRKYKKNNPRSTNRAKIAIGSLEKDLSNGNSKESIVFQSMSEMLLMKKKIKALHPSGKCEIIKTRNHILKIKRSYKNHIFVATHDLKDNSYTWEVNNKIWIKKR